MAFDRQDRHDRNKDRYEEQNKFIESIIKVNRVAKTVKGGRNFGFSVICAVGDGEGSVGIGQGKAKSVPNAIVKSLSSAKKSQVKVNTADNGRTIPHAQKGRFGASKIVLLPAAPGTGVIAGGAVRPILEALGIKDILTKTFGSRNPINVAKATMDALNNLRSPAKVAEKRGISVKQVFHSDKAPAKESN